MLSSVLNGETQRVLLNSFQCIFSCLSICTVVLFEQFLRFKRFDILFSVPDQIGLSPLRRGMRALDNKYVQSACFVRAWVRMAHLVGGSFYEFFDTTGAIEGTSLSMVAAGTKQVRSHSAPSSIS